MKTKKIAHLPLAIERNDDDFLADCSLIHGAFAEGGTARIAFTTPNHKRARLVEERKKLYLEALEQLESEVKR